MFRRRLILAAVCSALLAFAAGAIVNSSGTSTPRSTDPTARIAADSRRSADPISFALTKEFSAFQRSNAGDAAAPIRSDSFAARQQGLDLSKARQLPSTPDGVRAWLVPSADGLCIFVSTPGSIAPGGGCTPLEDAVAGNLTFVTALKGGVTIVAGVVPDGASNVSMGLADGSVKQLVIRDNAYVDSESQATKEIIFRESSGALQRIPTPSP